MASDAKKEVAPAPAAGNDLAALIAAFTDAIKDVALKPEQIQELIAGVAKGTAKAMRPENPVHPGISAFSYPEGDVARPKPLLKRITHFCGREEHEDLLTPGEIDAFNAFEQPRECRGGSWRAEIRRPTNVGGKESLYIQVPHNTADQRNVLPPSLLLLLTELNGGPSTENLQDMIRQIEKMKQMLVSKGLTATELQQQLIAS